ncbi:MAG: arsenic transporter [Oscillospiraceae bacterium]|nr:arsenic transporter [Oscillospiraceae bacterium]
MIPALILFIAAYVLMLCFSRYRAVVALVFGIVFILAGLLPAGDILSAVDWNVLLTVAGIMGMVEMFIQSGMPGLLAEMILERVPSVRWAAVVLAVFAGLISVFLDNVATVLIVVPVVLAVCKKADCNPVPVVIGVTVFSNLEGAATLVGDSTAIMLGSYAGMSFLDFFWYEGRPSIFFAVEIGALAAAAVLFLLFRRKTEPVSSGGERPRVRDLFPTGLLIAAVVLLIIASLFPDRPQMTNGVICMGLFIIGLAVSWIRKRDISGLTDPLRGLDLQTLGMLLGIYLIVGGVAAQGLIGEAADFLAGFGQNGLFALYTVLVFGSVVLSAFIDSIPYVAVMLPLVAQLSASLGADPALLYFGLLCGATLGGNLTPVGASANITGINILRREGFEVRNRDFFRIGVPLTLAAVIPAWLYIWLVY